MKIMVIEDDAFSQKIIVDILEKNSYEVIAVGSAKAALEFLGKGEFVDVIISDIMMPNMDGFAFMRQIRSDNRLNKIPVILCSVLSDKASLVKGVEAGIAGYIVKPVKEDVLISKVKKAAEINSGAVLVVDDEELIRNILVTILKREGYKVLAAESGPVAIDLLKNNRVVMVVSDIAMPEMDGFEVLSHVKEHDMTIPVLLMSGRGEFSREDIIATGADDFIPKPFHNTEILARVRARYK